MPWSIALVDGLTAQRRGRTVGGRLRRLLPTMQPWCGNRRSSCGLRRCGPETDLPGRRGSKDVGQPASANRRGQNRETAGEHECGCNGR